MGLSLIIRDSDGFGFGLGSMSFQFKMPRKNLKFVFEFPEGPNFFLFTVYSRSIAAMGVLKSQTPVKVRIIQQFTQLANVITKPLELLR